MSAAEEIAPHVERVEDAAPSSEERGDAAPEHVEAPARLIAPPEFPSEGQRAFAKIEVKRDAIALGLGISAARVSQLAHGRCPPGLDLAIKIFDAYGIPCEAWRLDSAKAPLK